MKRNLGGRFVFVKGGMVTLCLLSFFSGCAQNTDSKKILGSVNGKNITVKDFKKELAKLPIQQRKYGQSEQDKQKILEELVRKELLLQEANRRGLGQTPVVLQAIPKNKEQMKEHLEDQAARIALALKNLDHDAKEQTLIRELGRIEIEDKVIVNDDEVKKYYDAHRKEFKHQDGSLALYQDVAASIKTGLNKEKQQQRFNIWIVELQKQNKVQLSENGFKDVNF